MKKRIMGLSAIIGALTTLHGQETEPTEIYSGQPFHIYSTTLTDTAGPVFGLSDRLTREVRVDLQTRGGTRYQTDVVVRGGIFEGTGVQVGGLALFDPQTGHYFSEVPLEPVFFGGAELLTGTVNSVGGFNATAGSINWTWAPMQAGGSAFIKVGTDAWYGAGIQESGELGAASYQLALSGERGDGSIRNGDFELWRLSGRLEAPAGAGQLRLFGGYQEKFYGWPRMYTGRNLNETEEYGVSLLGFQWETVQAGGRHRVGGYWRNLVDDYEFRRETPNAFFEHETRVLSLQGDGRLDWAERSIVYKWVLLQDKILRSTSLTNGNFNKRSYAKGSLLVEQPVVLLDTPATLYAGLSVDATSEDGAAALPVAGLRTGGDWGDRQWDAYVEYASSSRVPGYTVLNSPTTGLFGGNPDLGREYARSVEAGFSLQEGPWLWRMVSFQRQDDGLVDWVYNSANANARQAQPVDITVHGIETWLRWSQQKLHFEAGYAWLGKDADYRQANVDASFYALNYAEHRLIVSTYYDFSEQVAWRLEGEYRRHPDNLLRVGGDEALRLNTELAIRGLFADGMEAILRVENLTNTAFQPLPGTPGPGREISLTLSYGW